MSFTRPVPRYRCHKEVSALKIAHVIPNPRGIELHFVDERFAPHQVDASWAAKHKPAPLGYWVCYDDGYQSYSPAAAFEAGYTLLPDGPVTDVNARARMEALLDEFVKIAGENPSVGVDMRYAGQLRSCLRFVLLAASTSVSLAGDPHEMLTFGPTHAPE